MLYPTFQPAKIEQGKMHIQNGDWDQAIDNITVVLATDKQNVEGLRIYCFFLLARENDLDMLSDKFDELMQAMRVREGRNSDLVYNVSKLFARFCGRRKRVIEKTLVMLEMAIAQ